MTNQNVNLPKLPQVQVNKLTSRLSRLRTIIDAYALLGQNADHLNTSIGRDFLGLSQNLMLQEIYTGFIAIISGRGLQTLLKSDSTLSPVMQELKDIKTHFEYARDKHYSHIDFDFDYQKARTLALKDIEDCFSRLLIAINKISQNETWITSDRVSHSVLYSLQGIIDLLNQDKQGVV